MKIKIVKILSIDHDKLCDDIIRADELLPWTEVSKDTYEYLSTWQGQDFLRNRFCKNNNSSIKIITDEITEEKTQEIIKDIESLVKAEVKKKKADEIKRALARKNAEKAKEERLAKKLQKDVIKAKKVLEQAKLKGLDL